MSGNVSTLDESGPNAHDAFWAVHDPGCVKTHTSTKCGKYNSPTRYRAVCAQQDLALRMRSFSEMFLRARRALGCLSVARIASSTCVGPRAPLFRRQFTIIVIAVTTKLP